MITLVQQTQRPRRGRPRKPPRAFMGFYLPVALATQVRIEADARGCTLTDYIGQIVAEAHGFAWESRLVPDQQEEEELPLEESA